MRSGEFAKLCDTTKNTLIHYDQMGLVRPSAVRENGYRDYLAGDAARFFAVRALADAGLSLDQVGDVLREKDPEALISAVAQARVKAARRRFELDRAERALDELERQLLALEAVTASSGKEGSAGCGIPCMVERPERALLFFDLDGEIHPGDDLDAMWERAVPAVKILEGLGPEAMLAQYGLAGRLKGGDPVYEAAYYELPGTGSKATLKVSGDTRCPDPFSVAALPAGKYLECVYVGQWHEIGAAYRQMVDYAMSLGVELDGLFCETSAFRLFDDDGSPYACTISAAVLPDRKPSQH